MGSGPTEVPWARAILAAIERQGLSERQVSLAAVGHESAIRSLKRGTDPRASTLAALARELGLEFHVGEPRAPARPVAADTGAFVTSLSPALGMTGVRFSAQGCAWFGAGVLADLHTDPAFCRAVEVLDSSMAPTLPPASVALVDLQRTVPLDGAVFLVGRSRAPMLRRLVRDPGATNGWRLAADNTAWPEERLLDLDELIGQALWRSCALPPAESAESADSAESESVAVNVTQTETGDLRPWAVPYRGRLAEATHEPQPRTDMVAWFEMDFLRVLDIDPLQAEVVTVSDASMMPMLPPSSAVLIDKRQTRRRHGAICAVWTGAELVLRRLVREGSRWYVATADGTWVRPFHRSDEVLGRAVWTGAFLSRGADESAVAA